jgi:hypothetical protein
MNGQIDPRIGIGTIALVALATPALAQSTTRVSVDSSGNEGDGISAGSMITPDGRFRRVRQLRDEPRRR